MTNFLPVSTSRRLGFLHQRPEPSINLLKILLFILTLATGLGTAKHAAAQTPVTIGTGTSASGANVLFSTNTGGNLYSKSATVYTAAEILNAGGIPGNITKVAWNKQGAGEYLSGDASLSIYIKAVTKTDQVGASLDWTTNLNAGTPATLVYTTNNLSFMTGTGWQEFLLQTPFLWDGSSNLEVFTAFHHPTTLTTEITWQYTVVPSSNLARVSSSETTTQTLIMFNNRPNIQFTITPSGPCITPPTPGTATTSAATVCSGTNFNLGLTGASFGSGQTYQWEVSPDGTTGWTPVGSSSASPGLTINQTAGTRFYRVAVTCGGQTAFSTPVSVTSPALISGTFTINQNIPASATNFQSFTDAINHLACGIGGPVVFNVVNGTGPYNEQVIINEIAGSSATNTITINGNGNTISFDPASANRAIIRLNGADYVTISNLTIESTGTTTSSFGWGIHFINGADFNTISNNTINIGSLSTSESNSGGIVFANSATTATSTGNNGNNNLITGNTITGGFKGIGLYGLAASTGANQIINNTILDFYETGIDLGGANATLVEGNTLNRPSRVTVSSTSEGITLGGATQNSIISKNRIHNSHGGASSLTGSFYGIYSNANDATAGSENIVKNNLVYGLNNTGLIYALYNSGSDGVFYYHNTVNLDHAANTGTNRGFFQTTAASNIKFMNNIVSIVAGTTGAKHAIYYGTTTSGIDSDRNVLFVSGGASTSGIGFFTSNRVTLADWQTASGDDANSVSANPLFAAPATGNFTPTNIAVNNIGAPVVPAVTDDITGATRSTTTPDPGAYEFTISALDLGATALVLPAVKSCYGSAEQVTITIKNWGSAPVDFSVTNVTVTVNVTGAVTQTLTITLNNNSLNGGQPLAAGATLDVPVGTLNMLATGVYTFNASTTTTGDGNPANDAMTATDITAVPVAAGTAAASQANLCQSGVTTLSLTGNAGGNAQWQQASSASGPFADVAGATTASYTLAAPISQTTYYRAIVSCGANTDTSNVVTVIVSNPAAPVATGDSRCGAGTVTLNATPAAGATIRWYDAATNGNLLATGNTFSPNVTSTTTFYAAATIGSNTENVGIVNGGTGHYIDTDIGRGLRFTANVPITLNHIHVYPTGTGTITIRVLDLNNTVLYTTQPVAISGTGTQKVQVPVNLAIPAGTYKLGMVSTGITNLVRELSGASYPYTSPSGAVSITAGVFGTTSTSATAYYWFYDWSISTGCESARTPVVATVNPAPVVNLGADITQCGTAPVVLDAGNAGATYQWSLNGTVITGATSQTLTATASGTYGVTVTSAGCSSTDEVVVTFGTSPATPTITAAGTTTFCQGGSVTLTGASATAGVTFSWLLNGVPVTGATSASFTATQAGDYRVVATLGGCSDSSTVTIVTVTPAPATPTITVAAGSSTTICQGSSVALTGASATTGVTFSWSLNGAPIAGATAATYTATTAGNYRVIATAGGCSDSSALTTVTVNPKPTTPVITKTGNQLSVPAVTGATYQWYSVAGSTLTAVPGATAVTFTPATNGDYTVRVTVNGCESDAATAMNVVLGIASLAPGMEVSVYPNPTAGTFTVNLVGFEKEATVQIISVTGQVISETKVSITSDKASKAFDLGGMAKGVYILKVTSGNNLTFRKVILD